MSNAQAYLEGIELLTQEKSSHKRRELLTAVTDIFLVTLENQNDTDNQLFSNVMERIAYELEVEARAQLSRKICDTDKVSRKLIVRLANDEIEVAGPVLERSKVLDDFDLIDIIRNRSQDHMHSIAGRDKISEGVSGELVDRGNDATLTRLTGNEGADLSHQSFETLADRARASTGILDALGARNDVPSIVMEGIKSRVADRMTSELVGSHPTLDDKFVGALVERCAEGIDFKYSKELMSEIDRLHESGTLSEEKVAGFAREKRLPDVVHCLALITGLDDLSVSQCLLKAELPALAILCKSSHFSGSTFLALAETRTGDGRPQASELAKAMRDYDTLTTASAERIMRFLKVRLKLQREKDAEEAEAAESAA